MERSDPTILGNDAPRRDAPADTTIIRAEIHETRERMGETIEEIGERLNPNRLKAQVKEGIHDATIGRVQNAARNTVDKVSDAPRSIVNVMRENPIPAAMIGIGLGWLLFNRRERNGSSDRYRYASQPRRARGLSDVSLSGYEGATEFSGQYAEPSAAYGYRGTQRSGGVGESVKDTAGDLADRAQDVAGTVAEQTRVQAERLEDQFYENPLAIAGATLALGLAAGLAIPSTQAEVELVGSARDKLVDRMRDVARETGEKVTQVAERVMEEGQAAAGRGAGTQPTI